MATGKITNNKALSGKIETSSKVTGSLSSGGVTDHNRLFNREAENQHPIEAITDLRNELDAKLEKATALPLIEEAIEGKAKGLYFDAKKELAKKSYWYLTAETDPKTGQGTKDSIISGPYDLGMGGGSGGGGGTGLTSISIQRLNWPSVVVVGADTEIKINWSSVIGDNKEQTGNGSIYLIVNNKQVEVLANQAQGEVTFNLTKYIIAGANNIQVKVIDAYGGTSLTVSTINGVTLELKRGAFDANRNFYEPINFTYVPYGDVDKTVYFIVDGEQKGTQTVKSTGESQTYTITGLTHGAHTLEVYFKSIVNGFEVKSNTLFYDLIYYTPGNTTPIIASTFKEFEQEQYIPFKIPYRVYVDGRNEFEVILLVNGEPVDTRTVGTAEYEWNYINNTPGNYKLTIKCGQTTKDFDVYIKKSTINVTPVTQDLALALNTQGRSNNEAENARNKWIDSVSNLECQLDNFNWKSNGWVGDADGNTVLRVSGDARITIPFEVFKEDFKNRGKTIELEIATSAVRNYSTTLISCLDKQSTDFFEVNTSFVEEDFRANIFKVNLDSEKLKIQNPETGEDTFKLTTGTHVFSYTENGWYLDSEKLVDLEEYGISISKYEINPEGTYPEEFLLIGDNIIVEYTLAARGFYVTPQIAIFRSQQSIISTQYKEDEHVRITFVVEKSLDNRIIWMYINGVASGAIQYPVNDAFRQLEPDFIKIGSNDAVLDIYNIRVYDNSLTSKQVVTNWIADTQNAALKAARYKRNDTYNDKNELIISKLPADLPYIIWDIQPLPQFKGDKRLGNAIYVDPTDPSRNFTSERAQYNVQGTSSSVYPTKNIRIKFKAKDEDPNFFWINDNGDDIKSFPITYPDGIGDNYFTFKVDFASSEGANNVELTKLYNDTCKELGILTPPQRLNAKVRVGIDGFPIAAFYRDAEGKDIFCTKANFNNDKANEDVYGFAPGDESWETTNNSAAETKYQIPAGADNFDNGFEIRFPDSDDWNGDTTKLTAMTTWVASTNRALATNEALPEEVTYTYDEVIVGEDNSETTKEITKTFTHDTEDYRLAKFRAELKDWFNVDSTLFYYVFTLLYLMIDSRAKNAFPTYFKSRQAGDGGDRWFWIPYDMDTAIGIDNKGKLTFDYNLEDTDKLDGADVFNGQDSVMWCNLRDSMPGEIKAMYTKMRLSGLISYEETDKRFEEHQGKWSESIFNEDAKIKYITPLANGDNYLEMLQGSKAQQRKWWLYNRFKYMDSKYNAGEAIKDYIQFRAYVESGVEKPNITITPYADIYATVSYANGRVVAKRAKRNEQIIIENPFGLAEKENDQETYIYSASQLKSIGDISGFKPDTVKIGNAIKLQELKIGDKDPNYQNPHLRELTVGNNILLKSIDARNCINLGAPDDQGKIATPAPDLSKCINIEEIYFTGTKIKGIVLPDGGNIKKLHLPETLTSLTIKNQPLLTDLVLAGTENIESLWLENIPSTSIKSEEMLNQMKANTAVRLIGINENYNSYSDIKKFYDLLDTKKGLTADGEIVEKAQITGTINIDIISYANYMSLITRYPEVKINTKQIICTVTFKNEQLDHHVINVVAGNTVLAPAIPNKQSTQSHYYVFEKWVYSNNKEWTPDDIIESDLIINAVYSEHLQEYTVTFDPASDIIKVEPLTTTVQYGSTITAPNLLDIPGGVILSGWYTPNNEQWIFDGEFAHLVEDNITLTAKWIDYNIPQVQITPINYNTFSYEAQDNLGITAWAVVRNSTEVPTSWYEIKPQTNIYGTYEVDNHGEYYFWVTDSNGNTAHKKLVAYEIAVEKTPGIANYLFSENDNTFNTTFAISGAKLMLSIELDNHYENLTTSIDGITTTNNPIFTVSKDTLINIQCTPKDYTVLFDLGGKGDLSKAKEQSITYLHLVDKPAAQYYQETGEVIDSWYIESEFINKWDFENNTVEGDMTLYAKWVAYHTPTIVTVQIPEGTVAERTIVLCYSQTDVDNDHKVVVDWDDNSEKYSSLEETMNIHVSHTYEAGTYKISILGPGGGTTARYMLGDGFSWQLVNPSSYITDVEFSWDLKELGSYALKDSSIKDPKISEYMSSISIGCYANCQNIESLNIPDNIVNIEDAAFSGCSNIKGKIKLPETLVKLGNNAFDYCQSFEELEMIVGENFKWVDVQLNAGSSTNIFRNCSSLKTINVSPEILLVDGMFSYCNGLEELNLSNNIADRVFERCSNLKKVTLGSHTIGARAFSNCENLMTVYLLNPDAQPAAYAFNRCPNLNTFGPLSDTIEDSPYNFNFAWKTKIPDYAFARSWDTPDMTGGLPLAQHDIEEVTLPVTLKEIGAHAFLNATKLKQINLPESLETIGEGAFEACTSLPSIEIPAAVIDIKPKAFYACTALTKAIIKARSNSSSDLLGDPGNAWFLQTNKDLMLYIPSIIVNGVQLQPADYYGTYWNVFSVSSVTGDIVYLSYTMIDDEID